ncbi:MAG: glycosyltransferase family 39 protein [Armatimonadota bacterium]
MDQQGDGGSWQARVWPAVEAVGFAAYLLFALAYAFIIPHGGAPDEPGHAIYVRAVADGHVPLPGEDPRRMAGGGEELYLSPQAHHPPLYYVLVAGVYMAAGRTDAALYTGGRLLSVAFGLAALLLTRWAALRIFPDRRDAVAVGIAVACCFSTYQIVGGSLNNEAAAALVVGVSLVAYTRMRDSRQPLRAAAVMGAVLGLGLLTKLTAAVAIVPMAVAGVAAARRAEEGPGWRGRALLAVGAGLLVALVIASPWMVRNVTVAGRPFFNVQQRSAFDRPIDVLAYPEASIPVVVGMAEEIAYSLVWPNWLVRLHATRALRAMTQWEGPYRPLWYDLLGGIAAAIIAWGFVRLWRALQPGGSRRLMVGTMLAIIVATLLGIVYETLLVDMHVVRWGSRYTPVCLPSLGVLIALSLRELLPARARGLLALLLPLMLFLDALALRGVIGFVQ